LYASQTLIEDDQIIGQIDHTLKATSFYLNKIGFFEVAKAFMAAFGSALGGFLGVMLFYMKKRRDAFQDAEPIFITEYECGIVSNTDPYDYEYGKMRHHRGKPCKLDDGRFVWEWTRDKTVSGAGDMTVYGPYTNDYSRPGEYRATFLVKVQGLPENKSKLNADPVLLELDVNKVLETTGISKNEIVSKEHQVRVAVKYIKASELIGENWEKIELNYYSDCTGVWEYRIAVFDGTHEKRRDNISKLKCDSDIKLFFDKIKIERISEYRPPNV
jgi:hypothetical protein